MYAGNDFFIRSDIKKTTWFFTFGCSTFGHILFFAVIFFFPNLDRSPINLPTVIDVDLVSMTEKITETLPEPLPIEDQHMEMEDHVIPSESIDIPKSEPTKQPETFYEPKQFQPLVPIEPPKTLEPQKPKPEIIKPVPEPEKIKIKPVEPVEPIEKIEPPPEQIQPKVKRSLKKKTLKKEKLVQNKQKSHFNDTIQRMKRQVRISEANHRIRNAGETKSTVELMDIYKAEVMARIQRNWALSYQLVDYHSNLNATLAITIMRNGLIRSDMTFIKRSGNVNFDESVLKAVKKSNPLPPLPRAYLPSYYGPVGLNFTPSGLK
jgi:colicin import membrane protein